MNHISLGSRRQDQRLRLGTIVDECVELGVESALGATDDLSGLPACWIGPVTGHFDVRGIHRDQPTTGMPRALLHDLIPQPGVAPAAEVTVDGLPADSVSIKGTPRSPFPLSTYNTALRPSCKSARGRPTPVRLSLWYLGVCGFYTTRQLGHDQLIRRMQFHRLSSRTNHPQQNFKTRLSERLGSVHPCPLSEFSIGVRDAP